MQSNFTEKSLILQKITIFLGCNRIFFKMTAKYTFFLLFVLLIFYACNSNIKDDFIPEATPTGFSQPNSPYYPEINTPETDGAYTQVADSLRQIRYEAEIQIETDNYEKELKHLKEVIKKYNGIIVSENEEREDYYSQDIITVKILSQKFDTLLNNIVPEYGKIVYKNITSEDITANIIDLDARLNVKKATEEQLLKLLKQAATVSEILEVNRELERIREDIEATESLLKFYKSQATYATVTITVYQQFEIANNEGFNFFNKLKQGILAGWHLLLWIIIAAVSLLPLGVVVFIIVLILKKRKKHKNG